MTHAPLSTRLMPQIVAQPKMNTRPPCNRHRGGSQERFPRAAPAILRPDRTLVKAIHNGRKCLEAPRLDECR